MVRPAVRPATIHYRRLEDVNARFLNTTLEKAVRSALETNPLNSSIKLKDDFHPRVWTPSANGDSLFANEYHDGHTYVFGDLVHFTSGHKQALFSSVPDPRPRAPMMQMRAPKGEFIHSMLYWYIRDNHAFVLQGRTARTAELENYLSWLLTSGSSLMKQPLNVILYGKFKPETVGGDFSDIEEINIGGTLRPNSGDAVTQVSNLPTKVVVEEHTAQSFEGGGRNLAAKVINAVTGDPATTDDFLGKIDPKAELRVKVTIGLKSSRTKIDKRPLKDLEIGLRNLPEAEVSVKAKGGKSTPLGELQLTYPTQIEVVDSLWKPDSVQQAFERAYKEFVESGRISITEENGS